MRSSNIKQHINQNSLTLPNEMLNSRDSDFANFGGVDGITKFTMCHIKMDILPFSED